MSPLQGNLAIRVRNKIGNICPECRREICKTKRGRRKMFFYDLKVGFMCFWFLVPIAIIFIAFTLYLAFYVL